MSYDYSAYCLKISEELKRLDYHIFNHGYKDGKLDKSYCLYKLDELREMIQQLYELEREDSK